MSETTDVLRPLTQNDIQGNLKSYLANNGNPGLPTGFRALNEFYSLKQGGITDWTGFPSSGKTYFVLEILMGQSERYGKRHGLWLPDIGSNEEVIQKLIKMRTGKDFHDKFQNKISEDDMTKCLPWIFHHFVLFKKTDFKKGIAPINFWDKICSYKDSAGELDTGLSDSWKNFLHSYKNREDSYLDEQLSIRNEMFQDSQKHLHTIAHAKQTELAGGLAKGTGKRRIPTASDIKGGESWYANGKNIITVHRPDKTTTGVDIHIQKVKPEDVGHEGPVTGKIFLDPRRGRYYENILGKQCYSYDFEVMPHELEIDFSQERQYHNATASSSTLFTADTEEDTPF